MDALIVGVRHALHDHLFPQLQVYDLFSLAGTSSGMRLAVMTSQESVWQNSAQQTLRPPHPALSSANVAACMRQLGQAHNNLASGSVTQHTISHGGVLSRDGAFLATIAEPELTLAILQVRLLALLLLSHAAGADIDWCRRHPTWTGWLPAACLQNGPSLRQATTAGPGLLTAAL